MEPEHVTFQQLEEITDGFSEARKLGQGSYGKVYRGEDKNGGQVAVKLLTNMGPKFDNMQFQDEFDNLRRLNHPNIVKLYSYCFETQHKHIQYNGESIFAETINTALCMEYMQHGSLEKYISGESDGLDWRTRYSIIVGASEGLKYLHEGLDKPIYHLDIKPDNILLDKNMLPKLADFGLSKVFNEEQTLVSECPIGTPGYLPPEFIEHNVISKMFDIFSLGVVMIKIIAGPSGRTKSAEMPRENFIDQVHRNWKRRLLTTWSGSTLETCCQQVKRCTEIALDCMETDRHSRPTIGTITDELIKIISYGPGSGFLSIYKHLLRFPKQISCDPGAQSGFLSVDPLPLESPLQGLMPCDSRIACPLHLTNSTNDHVAFIIHTADCFMGPLWGVVPPNSKYTRVLTMSKPLVSMYELRLTLESSKMVGEDIRSLVGQVSAGYREPDCRSVFERAREKGREVHQLKVTARYEQPGAGEVTTQQLTLEPGVMCSESVQKGL
ncbi:hypothetical protein ACQ4PT_039790 [Festuca glaucescens]